MKSVKSRKGRRRPSRTIGREHEVEPSLTTAQAARMLRVTTSTVARWARERKVPCHFTMGGHRRFDRIAIEELSDTVDRMGGWRPPAKDHRGRSRRKGREKHKQRSGL
jgi:excisionase family DNA binding protein